MALVAPDTVLDASMISVSDATVHKEATVNNVTAELTGRRICSMTAGAVVSGFTVMDTSADFPLQLVSIDSICMQWVRLLLAFSILIQCSVSLPGSPLMRGTLPARMEKGHGTACEHTLQLTPPVGL